MFFCVITTVVKNAGYLEYPASFNRGNDGRFVTALQRNPIETQFKKSPLIGGMLAVTRVVAEQTA
jgi:hypothetical protein